MGPAGVNLRRRSRVQRVLLALAGLVIVFGGVLAWLLRGESADSLGVRTIGEPAIAPGAPGWSDSVQVRSLGVAGWLVRRGDDAFATGPLYSYPGVGALLGFGRVEASRAAFEKFHPKNERGVKALLAGHAHYDHAIYLPLLLEEYPEARAYGSSTLKRILAGFGQGERVTVLDESVDSRNGAPPGTGCAPFPSQAGEWVAVPESRMRIRALAAHHSAQVLGVWHLWPGCLAADRSSPPRDAADWVEGPAFAFLVDFLAEDGVTPAFRVYYQDGPSDGGDGKVPDEIIAERAVDLAFIGVGSYRIAKNPESIVDNLKPTHVVLHHWEGFFGRDPRTDLRQLPLHDVAAYRARLQGRLDALGGARTMTITAPDVLLRYDAP